MLDKRIKFDGLGDLLFWSYANTAMLTYALDNNLSNYDTKCFMIRAKLYKGLRSGSMGISSMRYFQKSKMEIGNRCFYCGVSGDEVKLQVDHILPISKGGSDSGDNLVLACQPCNNSKRDLCLMEWIIGKQGVFPYLNELVMFLKLVIEYCVKNGLMEKHREELDFSVLPFNPNFIPVDFPQPSYFIQ